MAGRPAIDVKLQAGECTFGPADAALLRAIDEYGSIHRAADELGRSYAHAQRRLDELESAFGDVLERTRGGTGGGGSTLTTGGRELLSRLDRLRAEGDRLVRVERTALAGDLGRLDGRLGVIETAAGPVRALADDPDEAVTVSVPADAVTLHRPDAPPASSETSARNRFRGQILDVARDREGATVSIEIGAESPLTARITAESLARLDLSQGDEVVAAFKATATRAVSP